jgi:2-polyprenyl-6-methoxyphenol hydroxylase-like FAD-dependent oxidoreductase
MNPVPPNGTKSASGPSVRHASYSGPLTEESHVGKEVDSSEIVDVVQVGYGPVGQVIASLLGREGFTMTVLEKHVGLYSVSRAGSLDHEAMRILQSVGIADDLEPKLAPMYAMDMIDAQGEIVASAPFATDSVSGWRRAYGLYQPDLEDALDRAARTFAGVEVLVGWEVIRVDQHDDHVEIESRERATGNTRIDRGRYLIGADGANSSVREAVGIERSDFGYVGSWLVCDYEHTDPLMSLPFYSAFVVDPQRPTLAGRWLGRRHSRMEFMIRPDESPADFESLDVAWDLSRPYGLLPETSRIVRNAVYQFRSLLAENWRVGRVILAGDSAHVMPPFMGQGMCSGLRDGVSLAWRLKLVLRGQAGPELLDSYAQERRDHVEQVIRASMGMGWLVSVTDPDDARERDADLRSEGMPDTPPFPGLTGGVLLSGAAGAPTRGAGDLSAQPRVSIDGRQGRLDDLTGSGWRIITRRAVETSSLTQDQRQLLDTLDARIVWASPVSGTADAFDFEMEVDAWLESLGAEVVIVRPDFYTYGSLASVDELGAALDYLRGQLELVP